MDTDLEQRWRTRRQPFDGQTLATDSLPLRDLHTAVRTIVETLTPVPTLITLEDWHEHDGCVVAPRTVPWSSLIACLESVEAMRRATTDDTFVRVAWYPPDLTWYLRWCISTDPDDFGTESKPADGDADLTASDEVIAHAFEAIRRIDSAARTQPAALFFDARWAG